MLERYCGCQLALISSVPLLNRLVQNQYAQPIVQGEEFVIIRFLLLNANALIGAIPVHSALVRLGHLHRRYHLRLPKVHSQQQDLQYHISLQNRWMCSHLVLLHAVTVIFSGD